MHEAFVKLRNGVFTPAFWDRFDGLVAFALQSFVGIAQIGEFRVWVASERQIQHSVAHGVEHTMAAFILTDERYLALFLSLF